MTTAPVRDEHPRERLLRTAARLFYAEGVHAVGVDRLVKQASVTRATFYRHFPAKDDLVAAYLAEESLRIREGMAALTDGRPPRAALVAMLAEVGDATCADGFRGCQFLNAAAEHPDPAHPVRAVVDDHRRWFAGRLRDLAAEAGCQDPDHVARVLVLLRDGALSGGDLDDPALVRATLRRAVEAVVPER
ncbi:TetR/AcrR family transcriptional regulator [Actinosynnema pretiosum subsp. pretiosum]|uniref:Transcriptional regulator, TetR family n=2 Tax=Actinosynnema TaxID=40566 RepID=C6WGS2_ACTMD|nr:TetR/AcrR family transcriptional regulator [Actinosynnema mirum]ACU34388.1 transcriptional regulator, TetR family [Actinosynnema mirum DSM 43827]AXX27759.1 Transcriptional regulator, TetR family [Actinosynnema pretiosum subsp. pretiosum]QUF01544.1 TetR/AcrR family transcriptional regulator [Actinosynnema pretiosum subsp. pretiosum]